MGVNATIAQKKVICAAVNAHPHISGRISAVQKPSAIHGVLPEGRQAIGVVNAEAKRVDSKVNVIPTSGDVPYSGAYQVTPQTYEPVVLETMHRFMRENVKVEKIPQFEVSNESGGTTLIIGEEYYG